ncbi:helix-turn-helix transcriptional regulator [Chroococcidiopsis sp. CCMEE 29]|uniref:helix-turn-helix domain-containing protein n=1 Tax=Chroococcidiopsis sp. CCMEE 29 TaxID=155894 RepID=UPI00201FE181|nr:helix-turn-helix transcriptional regulator [Chroococcidiopsis sp. CCMEE 29]
MNEETGVFEGSGNVYADLGLADADELYMRAKIGVQVLNILKERHLKQREVADLLGIVQPDVSLLMRGRFNRFSTEKLLDFLKRLDQEVILVINSRSHHHQHQAGISLPL